MERIDNKKVRDLAHKLKTPLAMAQMGLDELKDAVRSGDDELGWSDAFIMWWFRTGD